jgi:hypothetical protein
VAAPPNKAKLAPSNAAQKDLPCIIKLHNFESGPTSDLGRTLIEGKPSMS